MGHALHRPKQQARPYTGKKYKPFLPRASLGRLRSASPAQLGGRSKQERTPPPRPTTEQPPKPQRLLDKSPALDP